MKDKKTIDDTNHNVQQQITMSLRYCRIMFFIANLLLIMSCVACAQKKERISNARKFINEWNYERALTEIIAYREDKNPEIQYLLGYCYLRKNECDEAAAYFKKSLSSSKSFKDSITSIYNILAQNALKANDPNRALSLYQDLAKLVPEYNQASNLFIMGDLNFEQGNYLLAIAAYVQALAIDSTSSRAKGIRPKLIKALMESDSFDVALRLAQREYERLKIAENLMLLSEVKFTLAGHLFNEGLLDSAQFFYKDLIMQQEPKSLLDDAYFYLGEIYFRRDSFKLALEAYKKVLRLNPYQKGELVKKTQDRINEIKGKK